ncbi:Formyl-coenzyme A transferase [sediment metagenome]|uniref:Formyl-coenzyme A transferase n=1 Tax=sediment metagenome TaxID=749907 RepID=D9PM22_9ZZZZ
MDGLGFGYQALKQEKPDLIVISMPAFGNSGPYRDCIGYGLMINSLIGIDDLTGFPGRTPPGLPIAYADHVAAWAATVGILSGLRHRRKTGRGCFIEIPQMEAMCSTTAIALLDFLVNRRVGRRMGNRLPPYARAAAPHGVYPCKGEDRWCAIAVFTEDEWVHFVKAIGCPDWTKDPRFATILSRSQHMDELDQLVSVWTRGRTPDEVMDILQKSGVAAGAVREIPDLVENDGQLRARGFYVERQHPEMGTTLLEDIPFKLSDTPGGVRRTAPLLGEHNDFVFREILGMPEEEINQYIVDEVI